jgi:hypothetical protein
MPDHLQMAHTKGLGPMKTTKLLPSSMKRKYLMAATTAHTSWSMVLYSTWALSNWAEKKNSTDDRLDPAATAGSLQPHEAKASVTKERSAPVVGWPWIAM